MKTTIYSQHHEHNEWLNKLSFYNDEITIMQNRLDEVSTKNNSDEVRKGIEHFQNQVIIQKDNADKLKHHIKREEREIQEIINKNPVASDHRSAEDHSEERGMIEHFENNFNSLRKEYNTFLSKWM